MILRRRRGSISPASRTLIGGQLDTEGRRDRLQGTELPGAARDGGIPKHCDARQAGHDLLEQLQPSPAQAVLERNEAGRVGVGMRHIINEPRADWIGNPGKHDRHGAARLLQGAYGRGTLLARADEVIE